MKIFFLSCESPGQFQAGQVTVIADDESEAIEIAEKKHGDGYKVMRSAEIEKGIIDY